MLLVQGQEDTFIARADGERISTESMTPPEGLYLHRNQGLFSASKTLWLETRDGLRRFDWKRGWSHALLRGHAIHNIEIHSDRESAWVTSLGIEKRIERGLFVVRSLPEDVAVEVDFAGTRIDSKNPPRPLDCDDSIVLAINWPGLVVDFSDAGGWVEVEIRRDGDLVAQARHTIADSGDIRLNKFKCHAGIHSVRVEYGDAHGSTVTCEWPRVEFVVPIMSRRHVRTGLAFLALLCVAAVLTATRPRGRPASAWLPSIGVFLTGEPNIHFLSHPTLISFGFPGSAPAQRLRLSSLAPSQPVHSASWPTSHHMIALCRFC
ncbi:hypothetical protein [Nannocystis pusilla]|uniref:hypothetical protein n=1 Tax=Nannocystis pusilla TaxID=889268 RepID=UPI003B77BEC8